MTRVAYFISSMHNPGGMERVLTTKVNYFVENYPAVEIFIVMVSNKGFKPFYPLDSRVNLVELNIDFYEGNNPVRKIVSYLKKQREYKKQAQEWLDNNSMDICISYFGREIDFFHKLTGEFKKVGELHFSREYRKHIYANISNNYIYKILAYVRDKQLIKNVKLLDKLVVLTKADKNAWLNEGIKHVECIYNPSPLHTELRTNINAKNVIAIGRLVEQKGFKVLLRIWSKIASNYPEWNLIIYGQGPLEIPLKSQINESNITNVSIRPFISDVEKIYSNASIIASTSNFEGLPMVLIEAQSSGVPCIAFDCPCGPAEIIDDGKSGYVIPLHDEEMYTTKLKQMLSNDSLLTGFSKQALLNSTQYSIDSISMCWMQLFNRLSNDH